MRPQRKTESGREFAGDGRWRPWAGEVRLGRRFEKKLRLELDVRGQNEQEDGGAREEEGRSEPGVGGTGGKKRRNVQQ